MIDLLFWASYLAIWALVLLLFAAVFLLYRHQGRMLLNSRDGRATQGPKVGERTRAMRVRDLRGQTTNIAAPNPHPLFIFFAQTVCKPCTEALPTLAQFAQQHSPSVDFLVVCAGTHDEVAQFTATLPDFIRIVPDARREIFAKFDVSSTPFALILDRARTVRGKGMPVKPEAFQWFLDQLREPHPARQAAVFAPIDTSG